MRDSDLGLDFERSSDNVNPVTTVDAVAVTNASHPAAGEISAPRSGRHTLQANCGSAPTAGLKAFYQSDNISCDSPGVMSPADRYVASRVGGRWGADGYNFSAGRTYVQKALDLIDGATVAVGTRLAIRKNQTTQTIGTKESYCPACQLVFATGWATYHLNSKQHQFTVTLCTVISRAAESEDVT